MRHIILCGIAILFAVSSARAGDIVDPPINLVSFEENVIETPTWAGAYLGLSFGLVEAQNTYDIDGLGMLFSNHGSAAIGTGYIGRNWQRDDWVYGIEAEVALSKASTKNAEPFVVEMETKGFVSAKARLGRAFGDFLIFGSIGAAYVFADHTAEFAMAPFTSFSLDDSNLAPVYGGGIEYSIADDFVLRAGYQYLDFGVHHERTQIGASVLNSHERATSMHIATFGIAKQF